jgi:hypothetical protein
MANPGKIDPAVDVAVDRVFPKSSESKNAMDAAVITEKVAKKGAAVRPDPKDVGLISDAINKAAKETDPSLPSDDFGKAVVRKAMEDPNVVQTLDRISRSGGSWVPGAIKSGLVKAAEEEISGKREALLSEIGNAKDQATSKAQSAQPAASSKPALNQTSQVEVTTAGEPPVQPQSNAAGYNDIASLATASFNEIVRQAAEIMGTSMKDLQAIAGTVSQGIEMLANAAPNAPNGTSPDTARNV